MSIVEFKGGTINHRYLMNKSKSDLSSMVMDYLREWEKSQSQISTLESTLAETAQQRDGLAREVAGFSADQIEADEKIAVVCDWIKARFKDQFVPSSVIIAAEELMDSALTPQPTKQRTEEGGDERNKP